MFRDLARVTARLKGSRFEGAVIAAAEWFQLGADANVESVFDASGCAEPVILSDRHGLMRMRAFDASGTLTLTLLLGRTAPRIDVIRECRLTAVVDVNCDYRLNDPAGVNGDSRLSDSDDSARTDAVRLRFSAAEVYAFVTSVNDTNMLHRTGRPLVPGLMIMEKLLSRPELDGCSRIRMKFTCPVFSDQDVWIDLVKEG